ncbi:MAG: hypothetical protein JF601_05710 [Acidobacteria bacterium]|nr:hypothetical protein [Acidobacteriota bacterium]
MMRVAAACVVFALGAGAALAQTKSDAKSQPKAKPEALTLTGCVARSETSPTQYTLEDKKAGTKYRLTGVDFRDYIGKPVVVIGSGAKKLAIVGGLTPTPNVAAQAGAMDPSRAAVEAQTAAGSPGNVQFPEFKVKSIRPSDGSCPE